MAKTSGPITESNEKYKVVPLDSIQPHPKNYNTHPDDQVDQLAASIRTFAQVKNIVVWRGFIIAGEGLWRGMQRDGQTTVTVKDVSEWPEAKALAFMAADNELARMAVPDIGKLAENLKAIAATDVDLAALAAGGMDNFKLLTMPVILPSDAEPQIGRAEELQEKWQVKTGDLWRIGGHYVLCGDSTKEGDFQKVIREGKFNLIWTDPPYGVRYEDVSHPSWKQRQIINDDLSPNELENFIRFVLRLCSNHSIPGCSVYVACPAGTLLPTLIASFVGSGFTFHWGLVWVKDQLVLGRGDYHFKHENILYGWKDDAAHYFVEDRTQVSVFDYPRPKRSDEHPTMKPVGLVEHMIRNSSRVDDIIGDPFCGSGTTLIACQNLNRRGRGIEISPAYCSVTLQRMQDAFPGIKIERVGAT